jgi:hypothetical protein
MFSTKKLHDDKYKYEKIKLKAYNLIYSRCINDISKINRMENQYSLIFEVPEFVIGHSTYDVNECSSFIKLKLENGGFKIEKNNNILLISWYP